MEAPHAALWKNLPGHVSLPTNAVPLKPQARIAGNSGRMTNSTTRNQNSVPSTSAVQNFNPFPPLERLVAFTGWGKRGQ